MKDCLTKLSQLYSKISKAESNKNSIKVFLISPSQFLYVYKVVKVIEVIDGDTLDLLIDMGLETYRRVRVRLKDIDTPEIYGRNAKYEYEQGVRAKQFVENWLKSQKELYIKTYKDEKGKYGRYLAVIFNEKGEQLNSILLQEGLAVLYKH